MESRGAPVVLQDVQFAVERTRLEAVGTSRAARSATIYPAASGEVVAVHFRTGQKVAAGDVLVELDARDERLAVELARLRLVDAERLLDRYGRTESSGAVTESTMDAARTAVTAARLELDRAEIALADRTIKAPFAGFVGITDVDAGDRIGPSTVITTLDERSVLLVSFDVPELMIDQLEQGQHIELATWNRQEITADGEIVEIDSRIDPVGRTFVARAHVDNRQDRLRPGMSFRVALEILGATWPLVPEIALQWGSDGAYVWAVDSGHAQRVAATVVQRSAGNVLIDAALSRDAQIVVEGVHRMREGLSVSGLDRVAPAPEATLRDIES